MQSELQYSTLIRKKNNSYQYIITYKDPITNKWKPKSKQGFPMTREGKQLAQQAMDKAVDELKKLFKNKINPSLLDTTFKQFTDMYLEHVKLHRSINTVLCFKTVLNHFTELDNTPISKVSNMDIQRVVDDMVRSGIKSRTIEGYLRQLNTILRSSKDDYHLISELPTEGIKFKIDKEKIQTRALNQKEENKLLKDFKEIQKGKYYLVVLLALKCGLRLGEILGLTWNDINEKNKTITINKQWKQKTETEYDFGELKSDNSNRILPISEKTLNELKKYKKVVNMNNRLFNFKNTDSVSICINRLFKLRGYDITIHQLRHTYATKLIANGVDFKTAAKLLGHNVEQTMKTYSHVNDDMMKRAEKLIKKVF